MPTETPIDPRPEPSPTARAFGDLIGAHPLGADEETLLARMMHHVVAAAGRAPTDDERRFIDTFAPRRDGPIEGHVESIEADDFDDVEPVTRSVMLMITHALALMRGGHEPGQEEALRMLAVTADVPAAAARVAETNARGYMLDELLASLYGEGPPDRGARAEARRQAVQMGIGEIDYDVRATAFEGALGQRDTAPPSPAQHRHEAFREGREQSMRRRHAPRRRSRTDAPRGPSVFGSGPSKVG